MFYNDRALVLYRKGRVCKKLWVSDFVIFLIITFISSIRLNTGSDYYNYYLYFNEVKEYFSSLSDVIIKTHNGFFVLSYFLKSVTDFPYAIFVFVAVFSYYYLFKLLRSEVRDIPSALVCYFFLGYYAYSNNMIKQYIAMAFVMSAYLLFIRNHKFKSVVCCFMAVFFHYSALFVLIIMFLVRRLKPNMNMYWINIVIGIVGALTLNTFLSAFFDVFSSASGFAKYINWRRSGQFRLIAAVTAMCAMYAVLTYYIVKYKNKILSISKNRYQEIIFLLIGVCINIIAIRQWIINRMAVYFYQFVLLILPVLFESMGANEKKKLKTLLYCLMFGYMIFSSIFLGENEYFSYDTIFSGNQPISDKQYNIIHGWQK